MKARLCALTLCSTGLVACLQSTNVEPASDGGEDVSSAPDSGRIDARMPDVGAELDASPDVFELPDAFELDADGCPPIGIGATDVPPNLGYLTDTQAECMGLDEPTCGSCHFLDSRTVLWPVDAPEHPFGDNEIDPRECDIFLGPLPLEVACCMGLTAPDCAECHTANGQSFAFPWWDQPDIDIGNIEAPPAGLCYEQLGL